MIRLSERRKDYIIQVVLIVGSVLLALWLDGIMANRQEVRKKNLAIENIIKEVTNNAEAVKRVVDYHRTLSKDLASHIDSIDLSISGQSAIEILSPFMSRGLQNAGIQRTAWDMAVETEAISFFKYEMAYDITRLYDVQDKGAESTVERIMQFLTEPSIFDVEKNYEVIRVFQFAFQELYRQELYLIEEYDAFLGKYNK